MDSRLLKMFQAVAKNGGMTEASREIHLTPSALSHGLKALETQLGARLFDRVGRKLLLNQAGEQFLSQIEGPLVALDNAAVAIRALGKWGQSGLRVGASVTACQHLLPQVFRELRKDFPKLLLQVKSGDSPDLADLLRRNRVDLGLGVEPERSLDLELKPMFEDELLFVLSPEHPWADGHPLSKEEISKQPLIFYERPSPTGRLVDDYFRDQQIAPTCIMEIASITAIKEMVKLNLGVAVLAPWVIDQELVRGSLKMRPLGAKALKRKWVMAHLAQRRLGLAEEAFIRLCRTHTTAMRLDRKDVPETGRVR